jgi:hypothetical protein
MSMRIPQATNSNRRLLRPIYDKVHLNNISKLGSSTLKQHNLSYTNQKVDGVKDAALYYILIASYPMGTTGSFLVVKAAGA